MTDRTAHPGTIRRIAIFRALFLGDLLCTSPAFRALRRGFPQAEITLIGLPWAREFVERAPYIDRLLVFPGYAGINEVPYQADETARFIRAAHATSYDIAIQMHGDGHVSNGFVAELGARISLGYRRGADDRLSSSLPYVREEHEVRRWLRLVSLLGIPADDTRIEFPITPDEERRARALLTEQPAGDGVDGPLVGLHPGAKDPARRWPPERFAALADLLVERCNARIVLTGSASERPITLAVRQAMRHQAHDLTGATGLGEFAAVIAQLDLLVTNDTGASHLAAATETPSVVLFGPSRPAEWAPLDENLHRAIDATELVPGSTPSTALAQLPVALVFDACTVHFGFRILDFGLGRSTTCTQTKIGNPKSKIEGDA